MARQARDIYLAIMKAGNSERGLRLTADETFALSSDAAILDAACNRLFGANLNKRWEEINPSLAPQKAAPDGK